MKQRCSLTATIALLWLLLLLNTSVTRELQSEVYGDIYSDFESLSLTRQRLHHICHRELPAIYFQTAKDAPIRGNGSTIFYNRVEVCCEGYTRSNSAHAAKQCVPDCGKVSPDNCRNGFCRGPGKCECFDEFVRNEHGRCIHTCPIGCQHGRCYLNGTCACHRGYVLDPETRLFCRPHCAQSCGTHQECVTPGQCGCAPGFRTTPDMGCQPVCTPDCGHGKCVGPNQCECFAGYMKRPQRNVCEAECYINCENGFCESRYKCQCREGYRYDFNTTSCLPECIDNCGDGNGICIQPGVCRCFEGYELRGHVCAPICSRDCGYYGHCLAPNICGCGPGHQLCVHGFCDARGHCQCPSGLTHFLGKCLNPELVEYGDRTISHTMENNQKLNYEFNALIGRFFTWT